MGLLKEIDTRKKEISTDGYPMSIGEIISIYKEGGLDVHPEFQRIFRWKAVQKSKLIESILLGIPIPSIFVSQRKDGVWDVVDGQQRLSTILEFVGVLKNQDDNTLPASTLTGTKYLPSLDGVKWENDADPEKEFSQDLKFIFKREKIDFKIVKRESDENVKYELFQRLNTLGSKLSDQEVRNCILVMLKPEFHKWLNELANDEQFLNTVSLADRLIDEKFHLELVLRFIILRTIDLDAVKRIPDLNEFLTEKMIGLAEDEGFNIGLETEIFKFTFSTLNKVLNSDSFKRYNTSKGKFEGAFLLSGFEAVGIAFGRNYEHWKDVQLTDDKVNLIQERVKGIWEDATFQSKSGSGSNVTSRVPAIVPIGQQKLVP